MPSASKQDETCCVVQQECHTTEVSNAIECVRPHEFINFTPSNIWDRRKPSSGASSSSLDQHHSPEPGIQYGVFDGSPASSPQLTRLRFTGPPLRILLGQFGEEIWVHQSILCSSSLYFDKMMRSNMKEAQEHSVTLIDIDPAIFKVYQEFLYTRKIASTFTNITDTERKAEYRRLVFCYALGDRLVDLQFKDAVIDTIISNSNLTLTGEDRNTFIFCPYGELTNLIYETSPPGSALRRLIVDQHVHLGVAGWISEAPIDAYDKEFLYDLAIGLLEVRSPPSNAKAPDRGPPTCYYHEHTKEGKPCYKSCS